MWLLSTVHCLCFGVNEMKYQQPALSRPQIGGSTAGGFTLIEMIGVLAIIAILAAAVAPRVFEVIADSRGTRMATEIRALETAVTRYYADVGTIQNLSAAGAPETDPDGDDYPLTLTSRVPRDAGNAGTAGAWRRFNGPYLEKFVGGAPAVGTTQVLSVQDPAGDGTVAATATNMAFDLDNGGAANDTPDNGPETVVVLVVDGVDQGDFEKVDSIFDEGVAGTAAEKLTKGRVKFDSASTPTQMTVLIAYR